MGSLRGVTRKPSTKVLWRTFQTSSQAQRANNVHSDQTMAPTIPALGRRRLCALSKELSSSRLLRVWTWEATHGARSTSVHSLYPLSSLMRRGSGARQTGAVWTSSSIPTVVACMTTTACAEYGLALHTPSIRCSFHATCPPPGAWTMITRDLRPADVLTSSRATLLRTHARTAS